MTNLVAGFKPGVGPVLKIMRNDTDDPFTTPNGNHGKFLFNSEVQKVGYIDSILEWEYDPVAFPPSSDTGGNRYYYPPGSDFFSCLFMVDAAKSLGNNTRYQTYYLFKEFFGKPFMPLVEIRRFAAAGVLNGPIAREGGNIGANSNGTAGSRSAYECGTHFIPRIASTVNDDDEWRLGTWFTVTNFNPPATSKAILTVFDLPSDETPIPDYSQTPTSGQEVIRLDQIGLKIALPGRDVSDPDPQHFILHPEKVPAKIMASGEFVLPPLGTYVIDVPFKLTDTAYMDFHTMKTEESVLWEPPFWRPSDPNQNYGFTYVVGDYTVTVTASSNRETRVRYMIVAASGDDPTTGGEKILLQDNDGTQEYLQIKKAGSSDTEPALNDILLDTRLAYLPILAEGLLAWPGDFPNTNIPEHPNNIQKFVGERWGTVNFPNPDGLLPFLKAGVVRAPRETGGEAYRWFARNRVSSWGYHAVRFGGFAAQCFGESIWNKVNPTSIDVYAALDNRWWAANGTTDEQYESTPIGVRYYVFGIPPNL